MHRLSLSASPLFAFLQIGVGCMVDSCKDCAACKRGEEQMCMKQTGTYGALDQNGRAGYGTQRTAALTVGQTS